ncbi:MAG: ribonuclease III [Bacteroidaceae bacterium]|nr:ribonuclease III [Bacteroidaceae bacterium]
MLRDFLTIVKLPFRKDRELFRSIHRILGFWPSDIRLYEEALRHKSVSERGEKGGRINNERLEFLGDAVLGAVVAEVVYRQFPRKSEGFLTSTRSKIVQRASLNQIAQQMGIHRLVRTNKHFHNAHNNYLPGNAFEALVGAIYCDRGYDYCRRFIEKQILKSLVNVNTVAYREENFKSKLLEWSQKNRIEVDFVLMEETMEDNTSPLFRTMVKVEGIKCGEGKGYSKKESHQNAAKDALHRLRKNRQLEHAVFDAKGKRTAMEEEPRMVVPKIEEDVPTSKPTRLQELTQTSKKKTPKVQTSAKTKKPAKTETPAEVATDKQPTTGKDEGDEFDFSDITFREKTRKELIDEAEEQAFAEHHD